MVQLSGKMLLYCTGYLCVFLFTGICYPNKKTLQHMDRICPKLPNPSDFLHVKSMNVMMTLEKKKRSLGLDMFAFPPPFCVQSSFEIAGRRPFVHLKNHRKNHRKSLTPKQQKPPTKKQGGSLETNMLPTCLLSLANDFC